MNLGNSLSKKSAVQEYIENYHPVLLVILCTVFATIIAIDMYFTFISPEGLDEERLGQLGDFFGGMLNPFIGFITVCLLILGSFIQTKVLIETQKQLYLQEDEYNRKQLEEALKQTYSEIEQLYSSNIQGGFSLELGGVFKTLRSAHQSAKNELQKYLSQDEDKIHANLSLRKIEIKHLVYQAQSFT